MLKTPPAFFTMYLIANIIFPKKNSNNCNLVLNQSNCNCFFFSPTKMNLATFIFIVAKVIFLGGNPRERIFPNSIIHDSNLVGENLPFSFYFGFPRCVF